MGNAAAKIHVELDQQGASAGTRVSGQVVLVVRDPNGTAAESLQIVLSGDEKSHVHYTRQKTVKDGDNTVTETEHHDAYSSYNLINLEVPLARFERGRAATGQYIYPFELTLPSGLPSSMQAQSGRSDCSISYSISAHLKRPGMFTWDIHDSATFWVQAAPLPVVTTPVFLPPTLQRVRLGCCCCFCIDTGSMAFGAYIDRSLLSRGGVLGLNFACKNNSTANINSVEIEIEERVFWTAHGHSGVSSRTVSGASLPGSLVRGTEKIDKKLSKQERSNRELEACKLLHSQLQASMGQPSIRQTIDNLARDSYSGQAGSVVRVSHMLRITLETGSCVTHPKLEIPIYVRESVPGEQAYIPVAEHVAPPPFVVAEVWEKPELPPNWAPATQEVVALPVESAVYGKGEMQTATEQGSGTVVPLAGSIERLIYDLKSRSDDRAVAKSFVESFGYSEGSVLQKVTPDQFRTIAQSIDYSFEQAPVLEVVARGMGPNAMSCQHLAAALAAGHTNSKPDTVRAVAHLCGDLDRHQGLILAQLSQFERFLCQDTFSTA